jgi:hypothetical protein
MNSTSSSSPFRPNDTPDSGNGAGLILIQPSADGPSRILMLKTRAEGAWCFIKGSYAPEDKGYSLMTAVRKTRGITGLECDRDYQIVGRKIRFGKRQYWVGVMRRDVAPYIRPRVHKYSNARWMDTVAITGLPAEAGVASGDVRAWTQKGRSPNGLFQKTVVAWNATQNQQLVV